MSGAESVTPASLAPYRAAAVNPFRGIDIGERAVLALADLDGDGDLDLVVGKNNSLFDYYENTGHSRAPVFVLQRGENNPLDGLDAGDDVAPALADLDGDGDLAAGTGNGFFRYYQNVGNAAAPLFMRQQGEDNPFDGLDAGADVGNDAVPTFGDLDGDGLPDLVVGRDDDSQSGTFSYYQSRYQVVTYRETYAHNAAGDMRLAPRGDQRRRQRASRRRRRLEKPAAGARRTAPPGTGAEY